VYERIVVGTDGSDRAKRAVEEATRLAKAEGASLHLVSAYEPLRGARISGAPEGAARVWATAPDTLVQRVIEEAAAAVRIAGVQVETYARTGDPADALLDVAREADADLIVVGNRGMHGARRFVLGSVPNKVTHQAHCNVLVVATGED
jgi:nucleotide-binding universal stress UspA family protein